MMTTEKKLLLFVKNICLQKKKKNFIKINILTLQTKKFSIYNIKFINYYFSFKKKKIRISLLEVKYNKTHKHMCCTYDEEFNHKKILSSLMWHFIVFLSLISAERLTKLFFFFGELICVFHVIFICWYASEYTNNETSVDFWFIQKFLFLFFFVGFVFNVKTLESFSVLTLNRIFLQTVYDLLQSSDFYVFPINFKYDSNSFFPSRETDKITFPA